jgi:hypothetical protein
VELVGVQQMVGGAFAVNDDLVIFRFSQLQV